MTKMLKTVVLGGVILGLAGTATSTHAWSSPARTMYLTFSGPVALPGVSLGAGTYIFELAAPMNDLTIVRVSSKDRRHVYLTAFTNLVERPAALRQGQVVALGEHVPGAPPPVRVWYPAGFEQGREFIYRN